MSIFLTNTFHFIFRFLIRFVYIVNIANLNRTVYLSDATAGDKMTVSVSDYDPFDGVDETSEVMSYKEYDATVAANYKKVINLAISVYKLFIDDGT